MNNVITKNYEDGKLLSIYKNNKPIIKNIWSNYNILVSISGKIHTVYERDEHGNILTVAEVDTVTDEYKIADKYEYDDKGRVIKHISNNGNTIKEFKIDDKTDFLYSMLETYNRDHKRLSTYSEIDDKIYVNILELKDNKMVTRIYDKRDNLLNIIIDGKVVYKAEYNYLNQITFLEDDCRLVKTELDDKGRVISETLTSKEYNETSTTYVYDSDDSYIRAITAETGRKEICKVKNGIEIYYHLERPGELTQEKTTTLNDKNQPVEVVDKFDGVTTSRRIYTYNKNGKLMQEVTTYYNDRKPMFVKRGGDVKGEGAEEC